MKYALTFATLLLSISTFGQFDIEGYVYETGNRGYINGATITISNLDKTEFYGQTTSDETGIYKFTIAQEGKLLLHVEKLPFFDFTERIEVPEGQADKMFLKHEIKRKPGYIFDITLAEKDPDPDAYREALHGALIEVYNNTKKREELVIPDLQRPDFQVDFIKGNHYTILVRKEGFLSKRMEAYVDVKGCILCFEGVGEVTPGVTDNLTEANSMGVLLANVEMDRYFEGKVIGLKDIYYETNKSSITDEAKVALDRVARFIKDNPDISVELGSHTDNRGKADYNKSLSEKRAKAAVAYLVKRRGIAPDRLIARGYGEDNPTNKCQDGVSCTELEYAANRRTELKILKVTSELGFRTLRQMKTEELMDEILNELDAEGQVRVPEDGNVEDAIAAKNIEAQKELEKLAADNQEQKRTQDEAVKAEAVRMQQRKKELEKQAEEEAYAAQQRLELENQRAKEKAIKEREIETNKADQSTHIAVTQERESVSKESVSAQAGLENWIANQAVPVEQDPSRYSDTYTGYKIVILFSRYALAQDHPLFKRFEDMDVYTTADGNKLYMIESYVTKSQAEERLRRRFKSSFPNSYVVGFTNGVLTD